MVYYADIHIKEVTILNLFIYSFHNVILQIGIRDDNSNKVK